jgi:hypothetical protein
MSTRNQAGRAKAPAEPDPPCPITTPQAGRQPGASPSFIADDTGFPDGSAGAFTLPYCRPGDARQRFGLRQSSGAFPRPCAPRDSRRRSRKVAFQSGRGLPQSKTSRRRFAPVGSAGAFALPIHASLSMHPTRRSATSSAHAFAPSKTSAGVEGRPPPGPPST